MNKTTNGQKQRGAVAIEIAVLFLFFFTMLYAILAYSLPILLGFSFQHVSAEAGRAIYKVNTGQPIEKYKEALGRAVDAKVEESWLPPSWRQGCPTPEDKTYKWETLSKNENDLSYGHFALDDSNQSDPRFILHTCLQRGYNKTGDASEIAIIPIIDVLGVEIPSLPKNQDGKHVIKGETITRL